MKSLFIAAIAAMINLCPVGAIQHAPVEITAFETHAVTASEADCTVSWSIVMQDAIILLTDTGDPRENIDKIEVFPLGSGTPVKTVNGCYNTSCTTDLSLLTPGYYHVEVETDLNNTFSANVTVG